jgi:hypothetical protein
MSKPESGALLGTSDWQLEFARLVVFPIDPPLFLEQQWWQDITSEQPEESVSNRKNNYREEKGSFEGMVLSLRIEPSRVDWLIQPGAGIDEQFGDYPTIGPFREKVEWFVGLLSPWLDKSCPPIQRLAFTGKLLQPASSAQEAYRLLGAYLPTAKLDTNPDDFLFQVNRRRRSNVLPALPLNRISAWSKLNLALAMQPKSSFTWPEKCYSAVEFDINTPPESAAVLPHKSLPPLFRELASLAIEIAENGDTP